MARPQPDLLADLTKCKLPELKDIARELKLRVSGTKVDLINRILNFRQEQKSAIKIQQASRGWFVRELFKIKGKLAPKLCVNEADFYTLDPLNEIPFSEYIEHKDSTGVQYGFHMRSLYHLLPKMKKFDNPYTREDMKPAFGENINMRDQTLNENRDIAIRIGESLISSNTAEEYRNLSAMYFLTAMTLVSRAARNQMPWLYENYFVIIHNRA